MKLRHKQLLRDKNDKYEKISLRFTVSQKREHEYANLKNYKKMQQLLEKAGFELSMDGTEMVLSVIPDKYESVVNRGAGRNKKSTYTFDDGTFKMYMYSDIILMNQSMTDREVYEKIGMKPATYYRHKKAMVNSAYYKGLDKERLDDEAYIAKQPGNFTF